MSDEPYVCPACRRGEHLKCVILTPQDCICPFCEDLKWDAKEDEYAALLQKRRRDEDA